MKIFCIGRNYRDHAAEMGGGVPSEPMVFMKPGSAIHAPFGGYRKPGFTNDFHYEIEIVARIGRTLKNATDIDLRNMIDGIGLGIDFTARDLQKLCKERRHPWEIAKAFDGSAVVSSFMDPSALDIHHLEFSLHQNGKAVQAGNTSEMVFDFKTLISYISRYFTLDKGDLLFSGTPEGVGPVYHGDRLEGFLQNKKMIDLEIL